MKNKTTLSKQKNLIIMLSILVVVVAASCIAFPLVFKEQLNVVNLKTEKGDFAEVVIYDEKEARNLKGDLERMLSGEMKNTYGVKKGEEEGVLYTFRKNDVKITYQPYIFPEIQKEKIASVTLTNGYGNFNVYNDGKGNFFIKGAEKNLYNSQLLAELLLQARYMLSDGYVENPSDFADYGLSEENFGAKVEITDTDGNTNVVYVGSNVISTGQYYMRHADKENVYVMDSGAECFFNDVRTYLSADAVKLIEEQQRNYIEKFIYNRDGVCFFACDIIPDEQRVGKFSNQLHKMTYPADEMVLNTTTLYDMFSYCGSLSGAGVVEYGVSVNERKDELLAFYGLDNPASDISFTLSGESYSFAIGRNEIVDDITYYYVYSPYQDTVVMVPASSMPFVDYEIMDLFQENVFQYNIKSVESIELKYGKKTLNFAISGEGQDMTVSETTSGMVIDTPSFRQFYISLLNVTIGGYSSFSGSPAETLPHSLSFIVTLKGSDKVVFDFYSESTMNCHMSVDGKAGFKTDRKWIDVIIENAEKLMRGETIGASF